ncbi:hypothetical protein BDK51DRAFT_29372 [Blyttiomyces helicus]|uniref:Uncharacterized protein n=1 Tax=Blyttiomyces helicus TaxID=388810 RepID=A0A4P9WIK4_9FUNG|nr:hypothetical protein BDK51DRAFT_29372 [Blyttiomyces helicus]|eukprot:RKO92709.1 hypothetical protein BDK51DRAFT_29372 [Blyttiomyces helicus]
MRLVREGSLQQKVVSLLTQAALMGIGLGSNNLTLTDLVASLLAKILPKTHVPRLPQAVGSGKGFGVLPKTIPAGEVSSDGNDVSALNAAANSIDRDTLKSGADYSVILQLWMMDSGFWRDCALTCRAPPFKIVFEASCGSPTHYEGC